jgi:hypothetical protein
MGKREADHGLGLGKRRCCLVIAALAVGIPYFLTHRRMREPHEFPTAANISVPSGAGDGKGTLFLRGTSTLLTCRKLPDLGRGVTDQRLA